MAGFLEGSDPACFAFYIQRDEDFYYTCNHRRYCFRVRRIPGRDRLSHQTIGRPSRYAPHDGCHRCTQHQRPRSLLDYRRSRKDCGLLAVGADDEGGECNGMTVPSGIGAPVLRKEDDRFLRGRGRYVADFYLPDTHDIAFVRSPVAHGLIRNIDIPASVKDSAFTARDLIGVNPIRAATALPGFKHSSEPILAVDKVRYVGEIVAMAVGRCRAEAEDIASTISLEIEELEPVTDMLLACKPGSPRVHEDWDDNIFITFSENGDVEKVARDAAMKVSREIRTARQCMFPMEGRGVLVYRDARLGYLTVVSAAQMPHVVQRGIADCLGIEDGKIRVISPDVGGGFGYKGLLLREEVALAWLANRVDYPVRWIEDCREHLSANANCREHFYRITGYADSEGKLLAIDCEAFVDAGAYSVYPTSSALEAAQICNLLPGPYVLPVYRCRSSAVA